MADLPEYPHDLLPLPLREGYGLTPVSPLMRTDMQSGRAKQRRRYQSTPTQAPINWIFIQPGQALLFEQWYQHVLMDGVLWFNMKLRTPEGVKFYKCRFMDIYKGGELDGPNYWRYSAELELWERPTMDPMWVTYYPAAIRYMNVIDLALNREWPEA
ncbi:hypothetical protein [Rheinheimera sp. MM224]|uniref:hypothetical protein n=1 Tax=Rheinheimera sp. MM224 TaxID=3019969 RepID=UPI0021F81E61|nr:hypothetical protein [Rheinheimera sp. MM224]CAI3796052.1 hypothetical protein JAMGFMIE_01471 [Rheinheimera sp. MM224]